MTVHGAAQEGSPKTAAALDPHRQDADLRKEEAVEAGCHDAFTAVQHFERTHCLILQNMGIPYLHQRADLVGRTAQLVDTLGFQAEVAHDAVLVMDRFMSTTMQVQQPWPPRGSLLASSPTLQYGARRAV